MDTSQIPRVTSKSAGTLCVSNWHDVVSLSFQVDDRIILPFLPAGTRIAKYNEHTLVTLLARKEMEFRPFGWPISFVKSHLAIDLRAYAQAETGSGTITGFVVLKHLVSKKFAAACLRYLYKSPCEVTRMRQIASEFHGGLRSAQPTAEYHWLHGDQDNHFLVRTNQEGRKSSDDSRDAFLLNQTHRFLPTESGVMTCEVRQAPWVVWRGSSGMYECDKTGLVDANLGRYLRKPSSVYLSSGGEMTVLKPVPLSELSASRA